MHQSSTQIGITLGSKGERLDIRLNWAIVQLEIPALKLFPIDSVKNVWGLSVILSRVAKRWLTESSFIHWSQVTYWDTLLCSFLKSQIQLLYLSVIIGEASEPTIGIIRCNLVPKEELNILIYDSLPLPLKGEKWVSGIYLVLNLEHNTLQVALIYWGLSFYH